MALMVDVLVQQPADGGRTGKHATPWSMVDGG
jgi:hypothetical protein